MHRLAQSVENGDVSTEDALAEIEESFENLANLRPE